MTRYTEFIARLKAWQVFVAVVAPPLAFQFYIVDAFPLPQQGIVFAMHIAAMAAIFYVMGFSAKNLIMAERRTPVSFFDYSGPFFLMWFFPIGIWFVQPRVNKLLPKSLTS